MKWIGILTSLVVLFYFSDYGNADEPIKAPTIESKHLPAGGTSFSPIETPKPGQQETAAGQAPFSPVGPAEPGPGKSMAGEGPSAPAWPDQTKSTSGAGEIYFAAGTVSPDSKDLYVIFDKFLMHYSLPEMELKRKAELEIAMAPVSPSISMSKDSKYIYIISNGMLYQVDVTTFKIEKQTRITPKEAD